MPEPMPTMRQSRSLRVPVTVVLVVLLALTALPEGSRGFKADRSLTITSPTPLARVAPPFTVRWEGPAGRYAVFVDIPPLPIDGELRDLRGRQCEDIEVCDVSASVLQGLGVYVSDNGQVAVTSLPTLENLGSHQDSPVHELTIIPLDDEGRRIGTSAWQIHVHAEQPQ